MLRLDAGSVTVDIGSGHGRSKSLFVDSTPGQEPKTSPLPDRANPPLGVMNGNLAVHWDDRTGIITANPFS